MKCSVRSCPLVSSIHWLPPGCFPTNSAKSYILFSTTHSPSRFPHSSLSLSAFSFVQISELDFIPRLGNDLLLAGGLKTTSVISQLYPHQTHPSTFPLHTWTLLCMSIPRSILEFGIKERIVVDMVQLIRMTEQEVVLVEGQLKKIIHAEGTGDFPQKGQEIFALYRGTLLDGTEFDSNQDRDSPFNFVLGQGRVIKGWDTGFASMRKGERATLICSPDYAYGARGSPPKIPANATLKFEVELLDFKDKKKEKWEYSDEEKVAEALKFKEAGNEHLKQGNAKAAADSYKEGIDFVEHETAADAKAIYKTLQLNIAQAYLKLNKNKEASQAAGKVLKDDPSNLKALYRRGVAYSKSQDFDRAQADFKELLKLDPQNVEAKKELASIATALRQFKEKEKKVFGGIFSKGGLYDDVKTTEIKPEVKKVESEDEDQEDEIKHPEQPAVEPSVEPTAVPAEEPMQEEKPVEGHLKTE